MSDRCDVLAPRITLSGPQGASTLELTILRRRNVETIGEGS